MKKFLTAAGAALLASMSTSAAAAARCGEIYVVQRGDSLSAIAQAAFNDPEFWPNIYEFRENPQIIGTNPNQLTIGDQLAMPACPGQVAAAPPRTIQRQASVTTSNNAISVGFHPLIDVLTGGDYVPFTDEGYPGRGMMTQIVEAAMAASDLPNEFRVEFINDWGAHLHKLLPRNKYDFGFPWIKPDCADPAALPEDMQIRCDYEWSAPLYTFAVAYYGLKSDPNPPQSFDDLRGKIVCRPAGWYTFDMAEHGLRDGETFTLSRPSTVAACFEQLERGRVDYVAMNRFTGEAALASAGLREFIAPVQSLVDPRSFHVVAHRDNGEAAFTWMAEFNKGLQRIRQNGVWDQIVNWHLEKHRSGLSN